MPNKILLNPGIDEDAINITAFSISSNLGMGPTSNSPWYNGVDIPAGGYAIYYMGISRVLVANDDEELIEILNAIGGGGGPYGAYIQKDDLGEAIRWANDRDILVLNHFFESITTDGLVLNVEPKHVACFADNKTVTNVVTNTNLDTGWSKGYQRDIVFNEIDPPHGVDSPVVGFNRGQASGYWYSYGNYAPQTPGETYFVSVWVKTNDPNFRLNYYTANNSEAGRKWGPHISVPSDGQWHRIEWPSFVNSSTSQSDSLSFNFEFSEPVGEYSSRTWLCAPMMHTGTEHVPFVAGTRSQNNLIDLSNRSSNGTTVGNPHQDSNGNIILNGVDQHIEFPSHSAFNVDTRTIEITFKMNSAYSSYTPLAVYANGGSATNRLWLGLQSGRFQMHGWGTVDPQGNTNIEVGKWYTGVFSYDRSSQQMKMYTNGKLEATTTNTQAGISATSGMNWYLGHMPGGESWAANLTHSDVTIASFKVYDRILSDSEVAHNYYKANIVKDNLIFNTDASNLQSYVEGDLVAKSLVDGASGDLLNAVGYTKEYGGAWKFRSENDGIRFTPSFNLTPHSAVTINGWIKVTTGGAWFRWFSGTSNTSYHFPDLAILDNGDIGYVHSTTNTGWVDINKSIGLNTWAYVSYVFTNTGGITIYINSELVYDADFTSGSFPSNFNFMLGNRYDLNGEAIVGEIANTSIYTKALSQEEVLQNYNATAARFK